MNEQHADTLANGDGLDSQSLLFVEELYAAWLTDAESVPAVWQRYFAQYDGQPGGIASPPQALLQRRDLVSEHQAPVEQPESRSLAEIDGSQMAVLQERVDQLIRNFRVRGHMIAQLDPLGQPRPRPPELDLAYYGLDERELDRPFSTEAIGGPQVQTLRQVLDHLQETYCRYIGVQFMHIDDLDVREWLQDRMESSGNRIELPRRAKYRILSQLSDAIVFEEFIQKKFVGAKSFSLEGAETLIPLLDMAIGKCGADGVDEIVIGMAHRGRLNVLANVLGKHPRQIFREFEDIDPELHVGRGDVKYHLGYSNDWETASGRKVHLSLCFNPSHLEFVNAVALGRVRAKQDRFGDTARKHGLTLLIHGDAAFAGEGIIQETLNLSELSAYTTGGTLHVIVNNQIGFTTSPHESRSTPYCTDVARMLQIPIFHVNGENPEAVAQVVELALEFRKTFQRDVVIDMYCYRLRGHNEGDEPTFTQPLLYEAIRQRPSVLSSYRDHLLNLGGITREDADWISESRRQHLEEELTLARSEKYVPPTQAIGGLWSGYLGGPRDAAADIETGVESARLANMLQSLTTLPDDFHPHKKIERGLELRREMAAGQRPLDWSAGEALAFATLAAQGVRIRMTGQDVGRGTFSQRHAVLHDVVDDHVFVPLQHLAADQGPVELCNSPLSEAGVLGFEYGYSLDCPDGLVLWEAQFGDFVNAAQVIIDQFLASAEDKWNRLSGLVLLLPHGFEGQGPEHSSARLERFLALCADDNMQVVQPTTPAQYFHVLRRQVLSRWRKPLVVMTPKSLLRHRECVSSLDDCATGRFQRVIADASADHSRVDRVLLCSGKVYYELAEERQRLAREDVAIIRVEELSPPPEEELRSALAAYRDETPVIWVQEEPANMGAWWSLRMQFGERLFGRLPFGSITRPASSSPATGSKTSHKLEQKELLARAFGGA